MSDVSVEHNLVGLIPSWDGGHVYRHPLTFLSTVGGRCDCRDWISPFNSPFDINQESFFHSPHWAAVLLYMSPILAVSGGSRIVLCDLRV